MAVDYFSLGQRIQAQRKKLHMTQEQLAEAISVSVGYVSQIERGITKVNLEMLSKIADFLECDMTDFLRGMSHGSSEYLSDDLKAAFLKLTPANKKLLLGISLLLIQGQQGEADQPRA